VVGLIGSLVISTLPVFEMAGKSLLLSVREGNYDQAYMFFSDDYKKHHSLIDFEKTMIDTKLNTNTDVRWLKSIMNKKGDMGYIIGEVSLPGNNKVPLEIHFVQLEQASPVSGIKGKGWFIDDMYIGMEVIERQTKSLQGKPLEY
jgi:hypothetical protein